jgi:hypothetical protein
VKQYEKNTSKFDLYRYFQGATTGWGVVFDRKGAPTRQFVVKIDGLVDAGGDLIKEKNLYWSDGENSHRIWKTSKEGGHTYIGRAGDVIDTAQGLAYGNVLSWNYVLALESKGTTWHIDFDDWMVPTVMSGKATVIICAIMPMTSKHDKSGPAQQPDSPDRAGYSMK